nr:MAG TPA: hypothetical protein [Caudoviricetes sp.]
MTNKKIQKIIKKVCSIFNTYRLFLSKTGFDIENKSVIIRKKRCKDRKSNTSLFHKQFTRKS